MLETFCAFCGEEGLFRTCHMYEVNREKCTGCGACSEVCPPEAIEIKDGKAAIGFTCIDCGACPRVCPEGAIRKAPSASPA